LTLKKWLVSVGILGAVAAVALPAALAAGGAQTIAAAPTLPVGVRVGHAHTLAGCTGYGEVWRLPLVRGDHLTLDYGSKDGNGVQVLVFDPSATDNSSSQSELLDTAWTQYKDDITYDAKKTGRFTIVMRTYFPCQKTLYYYMTAHVRHAAK
jgi:hypothetical protein